MAPYKAILQHPAALSIAIQIREGDEAFRASFMLSRTCLIKPFSNREIPIYRSTGIHFDIIFSVPPTLPSLE